MYLLIFLLTSPFIYALPSASKAMAGQQLVFITADLADQETLTKNLGADMMLYRLTSKQSAIQQISEILRTYKGLEAVHLISHGSPGALHLGSEKLDLFNLPEHAEALRQWGRSLRAGGSFLLYGCEVAKGRAGVGLIRKMAAELQAPVAASVDLTGASSLGGNWILEYQTGTISTSALNIAAYNGLLQTTPPDGVYPFANATMNADGTATTADKLFLISGINGAAGGGNVAVDEFGAYIQDERETTTGTSYLEVKVKNGGSFKVAKSVMGELEFSGTPSPAFKHDFYNVHAVGYAGGIEVARTPMHNSIGIYQADYNLNFSAFAGKQIDVFRVYYSWNIGTGQHYFNLANLTISSASVTPSISTGTLSSASLCNGSTVSVPFTATGSFAAGNTFTAQLSDWSGSFASPVAIGTLSGTASGTITATIPTLAGSADNYRIRVISSNPVVTGTDNGSDLHITRINPGFFSTNIICNGGSTGSAAVYPSGGTTPYTYSWSPSGGTENVATGLTAGIYTVTITDAKGCTAQRSFNITQPPVPSVLSVNVPANGTYTSGNNLVFSINFSEPVTVNTGGGTPYITLTLNGGGTKQAHYISGSGTNSLSFAYTVGATDQDPDGISMGSAITLNGGTLQNGNGCTVATSITGVPSLAGIKIHNSVTQTITFNALAGKTYGDADFDPGATASSGLPVSYTSSNTAVATIVGGKVHIVGAGSTTITASQPGDVNYKPAGNVQQTLNIHPKALVVSAHVQTKTYGDADPVFTYGVSGLVGGDVITGSLTRAAGNNVGAYAIHQGSLTAGANYTITYTDANLTINPKAVTVTAQPQSKIYGEADPALTYTASGLVGTDAVSGGLVRAPGNDVGKYAIQQGSLTAGSNYTITYTGAELTITPKAVTVTAQPQSKIYGGADPTLTYSVSPALVGGDAFSGALSRAAGEDAGTYAIGQGSLSAGSNYSLTYTGADLTIPPKVLIVTAEAKTKTYGDADPALTFTTSGLVGGDAVTGSLVRVAGDAVGVYPIQQGSLSAGGNYALTYNGATFAITAKELVVSAHAQTKTYGDPDPTLSYTITGLVGTDAVSGTLVRTPGNDVGTYPIQQGSLSAGGNYTITYTGADLAITRKALVITAEAKTKTYGDADPVFTYSVNGLVSGDVLTGSLTRAAGNNVGTYVIHQGSLTAGANYTITYTGANLTINPKTVTVTAQPQSKIYGEADPALTYTVSPALISGDAFSGALSRAAGENVGLYPILQNTLALSGNYILNYTAAQLNITKKAITITAEAKNKTYGDADPALTYTVSPALVSGDNFTGVLGRLPGEHVGTYTIEQNTLALSGNYEITYTSAGLTITPKTVTVTAQAQTKTYGDADPSFAYTVTPALVSGDAFTGALSREAGEAVGDYVIQQHTLALNGNYILHYTDARLTIQKKGLAITADAKTKTYGDPDPVLTYTVSGLVGGDAVNGSLVRTPGNDVGTYTIGQGTLTASSNYTLTYTGASLTIHPKTLVVNATAQTKTYGDADPALTYSVAGLVGSDALTGSPTRIAGNNVGVYPIQQGSLTAGSNYTITYNGAHLTITPKAATVTAQPKSKTYGEADPDLTYSVLPALVGSDAFSGALSRAAGEDAGTYAIGQGSLTNPNYAISFTGGVLTIEKASQQITWSQPLTTGCAGITRIALTATASSGLPVSYSSADTEVATINNNEVVMTGAGTVTLMALQPGNHNYLPAAPVSNTMIAKLPSHLVLKRWDDVLVFDNSSNQYTEWKWYKNGMPISGATGQYFYESGKLNGSYHAVVKTKAGVTQETCPVTITPANTIIPIAIFPNPVAPGQTISVKMGYSAAELQGASIIVSNMLGVVVQTVQNVAPQTNITMPLTPGVFVIKLRLANGVTASVNALVKPQ